MNHETTQAFAFLLDLLSKSVDQGDDLFTTIEDAVAADPAILEVLIYLLATQLTDFVVETAADVGVSKSDAIDQFIRIQVEHMPSFMIPE